MGIVRRHTFSVTRIVSLTTVFLMIATMALCAASLPRPEPVLAATQVVSTQRVSVPSAEGNHNVGLESPSISADGRYVAFQSGATNLVAGDSNGVSDIFVHDRQTGETARVSVTTGGIQSDNASDTPSMSADGRYVTFQSSATNLVADDNNGVSDVFVHDRQTGETTRVSLTDGGSEANGESGYPSISADGRYVAFASVATNLVAGDNNSALDIFVRDRQTPGRTIRVSVTSGGGQANSDSGYVTISADGRYVAFVSMASNLVAGDNNSMMDVFVRDWQADETTLVSVATSGVQGNGYIQDAPSISADGRYVAFCSAADNLVGHDYNSSFDIFVRDRQMGETTRVSVDSYGSEDTGNALYPSISADGRYVAFASDAHYLVAGDGNDSCDVFIHDRLAKQTARVSVGSVGTEGDSLSLYPSISADGLCVAFFSIATNLVADDMNGVADIFTHDRATQETTRVSLGWDGTEGDALSVYPACSADGRYVAFDSDAGNLVAGDTNGFRDVFVHDRQTGATARVSVASDGAQSDNISTYPSISADGRYVVFSSAAVNLVAGDTNGCYDVFVHDRLSRQTTIVSMGVGGSQSDGDSGYTSISADGRYVAFSSYATNLVAGDTNGAADAFVHDRLTGVTTRVSVASGGAEGNSASGFPSVSADGWYVAFFSYSSNLVTGDGNGSLDVFVHDRHTAETTRASVDSNGIEGNNHSFLPRISADGRSVAFFSSATNLVGDDTNGSSDVFVYDRDTKRTSRVSVASGGGQGDGNSTYASISADGRYVAFASVATNLVAGDSNAVNDIFVRDRQMERTVRVSLESGGAEGIAASDYPCMSADGRCVAFHSEAGNLVPNDTNGVSDVFAVSWRSPTLVCAPTSIDFGDRYQNTNSSQMLQIRNSGAGTLAYDLSEASPWCSVSPEAGESTGETDDLTVTVDSSGLSPGAYSCVILVASDGGLGVVSVYLTVLPTPRISVMPASYDYGRVEIGGSSDLTVTVSSSGTADLVVGTVSAANPVVAPFSIVNDNCSGQSIPPGESRMLTVRFSPTVKNRYSDDFDIPSNDPSTPGVTVNVTGATPNNAPTRPVVAVTPEEPDTHATLLCSITAESTDADGETVTYTYEWYEDDVLQSGLTANTVGAAETVRGQVWRCIVTPKDFMDSGPYADDQVTIVNSAPWAPVVDVAPDSPATSDDLVCSVITQSTDADGDAIAYSYRWYKDDVLQSGLTANTVGAAETARGQVWKCAVVPSDGTTAGPSAGDQVTIRNTAPTAPVIAITPDSPGDGDELVCGIATESADVDGDTLTYAYQWYKDDVAQSDLTTNTVGGTETAAGQLWKCVVTPGDGYVSGPPAEAEVTIAGSTGGFPVAAVIGIVIGILIVTGAAAFLWFGRSKKAPPAS